MKKEKSKIIKKYFGTFKPIIYLIVFALTIYLSIKETKLIFALGVILLVGIIYIASFFTELKITKRIYLYKTGEKKFSFKPYTITKEELIEEIKNYGIPLSFIEINKNIYAIEVGKNKDKDKYLCYLDNIEFNSLDEFLNYDLGSTTINEQKKIKILAYNYQDPNILKSR